MVALEQIKSDLNSLFQIEFYGKDSAMSRFVPAVYEPIGFDWSHLFEPGFSELFNGLMLKGQDNVNTVFLAVFPTTEVLKEFIQRGNPGDLLLMHHPLFMECGDPQGAWGRGFVPIEPTLLNELKQKGLSIYTCHLPMDYNKELGTTAAICEALNATRVNDFYTDHLGSVGAICDLDETSTDQLITLCEEIFDLPYVDFEGPKLQAIERIAIVAGCGDVVEVMQEAESKGAQAYITGEIHCHIDNDYGRMRYAKMMEYVKDTKISLIGVSHSASEYLVKKTQIKKWLENNYDLEIQLIPQHKWWL